MADEHVSELARARASLVEQRRNVVADLAAEFDRQVFPRAVEMMVSIQAAIDAVDRAIDDEKGASA